MKVKNLIIGAGPAGLATAGRLRSLDIPFEIIEKSNKVGNSWHNHYDRLHLHTVKEWSNLPYLEFPDHYPTYVSRDQLVDYFKAYTRKFNIHPHFNQDVIAIERNKRTNDWMVKTIAGNTYEAENVIIATGVNRVPHRPTWKGEKDFQGNISHSRKYKNAHPYYGQTVLVIGMGNTGAEIALDLSENGAYPYLSVRGPVNIVPRDLNGRPVQVTSHYMTKLPFGWGDWLGTQIRKVYFGNIRKYGLEPSEVPPTVQLRETGKTPVVDIGTFAAIKAGKIKVMKDIEHFTKTGVQFVTGDRVEFDSVIIATGYRPKLGELLETTEGLLDKFQCPVGPIGQGIYEGLYFIGFDNYQLGGILGIIYGESRIIAEDIQTKINKALDKSYELLD